MRVMVSDFPLSLLSGREHTRTPREMRSGLKARSKWLQVSRLSSVIFTNFFEPVNLERVCSILQPATLMSSLGSLSLTSWTLRCLGTLHK